MIELSEVKKLREITGSGMLDCKNALVATNGNIDEAIDWLKEKGMAKVAKRTGRIAKEGLCNIIIQDNKALILELNTETDFVAQNSEFKSFLHELSQLIMDSKHTTLEEALAVKINEATINDMIIDFSAKIGEKINLRRCVIISKEEAEVFGQYLHLGGKIATLTLLDKGSEEVAKEIAMQATAMNFKAIRIDDLTAAEIEHERSIFKEQTINEGKPINIVDKIVEGKMTKYFEEICLEEQKYIKNEELTIKEYLKQNNSQIKKVIRYEVGEGIENLAQDFKEEVMKQLKKESHD